MMVDERHRSPKVNQIEKDFSALFNKSPSATMNSSTAQGNTPKVFHRSFSGNFA